MPRFPAPRAFPYAEICGHHPFGPSPIVPKLFPLIVTFLICMVYLRHRLKIIPSPPTASIAAFCTISVFIMCTLLA